MGLWKHSVSKGLKVSKSTEVFLYVCVYGGGGGGSVWILKGEGLNSYISRVKLPKD